MSASGLSAFRAQSLLNVPFARDKRDTFLLAALVLALIPLGLLLTPWVNVLVLVGIPLVALVVMFFVRYPRIWLYTGVLVNYFWIIGGKGDVEITPTEYALVAFIIGGLQIWLFSMVFIKKRKIVRNIADRILLFSVLTVSATVVFALVNDESSVLKWLREYLLFYTMLYYLPWREHFTERKHIQMFFALTIGVFVFIGATNLWQYIKAASNVLYAYQVWTARKSLNTHIFECAVILCSMAAFYSSKYRTRLVMAGLTAFYTIVVIVSFSRGFWISTIAGIIVTLWLFDKRKLVYFTMFSVLGAIMFILAVQVIFPDKATIILKVITARFTSSAAGTKDVSVLSRVYETQVVLDYIYRYFWSGTGLGATFAVYEPFERIFIRVSFIHNGYLFILMKLGIFFFSAFYFVWGYMMRKAYILARTIQDDPFRKILAAGAFGSLVGFTMLNVTSAIPETRDGFYCLAVLYAAVNFAEYGVDRQKNPLDRQTRE